MKKNVFLVIFAVLFSMQAKSQDCSFRTNVSYEKGVGYEKIISTKMCYDAGGFLICDGRMDINLLGTDDGNIDIDLGNNHISAFCDGNSVNIQVGRYAISSSSDNVTSINLSADFWMESDIIDFSGLNNSQNLTSINVVDDFVGWTYASEDGVVYDRDKTILMYCPAGKTEISFPKTVRDINGGTALHHTLWYKNQPDGIVYANHILYHYKGTMPENTSIDVAEGTTYIRSNVNSNSGGAFYNQKNLISIKLPESLKGIGSHTFEGCSGLTSVIIPTNITIIGTATFFSCIGLTSMVIPENVTLIGHSAFRNCSGLTSVVISENVTRIENYAFQGCEALASIVNLRPIPVAISEDRFTNVDKNTCVLYIPAGSSEAYSTATGWGDFVNIIELPKISEDDIDFTPTADGATIEWQSYEHAEGYKLIIYSDEARTDTIYIFEFDADGEWFNTISFRSASTTLSHTIENLQSCTEYFYTLEILGVGDVVLASQSGEFTTASEPASIDAVLAEPVEIVGYYSVSGEKLPKAPDKGVYIILYDNGMSEKRMK